MIIYKKTFSRRKKMVDLMQEVEFVKVGKLFMLKDGDGTLYTEEELKEKFRQNNKELQKEVSKRGKVKDDTINETDKADK